MDENEKPDDVKFPWLSPGMPLLYRMLDGTDRALLVARVIGRSNATVCGYVLVDMQNDVGKFPNVFGTQIVGFPPYINKVRFDHDFRSTGERTPGTWWHEKAAGILLADGSTGSPS
jgi:hypothetical protein